MEPTVVSQPAINEISVIEPVTLPDMSLTLADRVSAIEEELDTNNY